MSVFAERLRDLRSRKGRTQDEVGKVVGKSREAVSKYEIGEREPDLSSVATLAKYFDVSADYILGISDNSELINTNRSKPNINESPKYEKYLIDSDFVPYMKLAIKIKENNVDLTRVESYVDKLIEHNRDNKNAHSSNS